MIWLLLINEGKKWYGYCLLTKVRNDNGYCLLLINEGKKWYGYCLLTKVRNDNGYCLLTKVRNDMVTAY